MSAVNTGRRSSTGYSTEVKVVLFVLLLVLVMAIPAMIYLGVKEKNLHGPGEMVQGPNDTIYIQVNDSIAQVSSDGTLLKLIRLRQDLGIGGSVVDFVEGADGGLIMGLTKPDRIVLMSPGGETLHTYPFYVEDTPIGTKPFFRMAFDPANGELFLAASDSNRIKIYGADDRFIAAVAEAGGKRFNWPNGLVFDDGTIYAADANHQRVVSMDVAGKIGRIFKLNGPGLPMNYNTYDISARNGILAVVYGNTLIRNSRIALFDQQTGDLSRIDPSSYRLEHPGFVPDEIFIDRSDILVADPVGMEVLRLDLDGLYLGTFGDKPFRNLLSVVRTERFIYKAMRYLLILLLVVLLATLVVLKRKRA